MSYQAAKSAMEGHRDDQISSLLGDSPGTWFTKRWRSVGDMLGAFSSDPENAVVAANYASGPAAARAASHVRLDYVCALRREVRKQYVSWDGDVCTDVTPFRHGVMSAHGAALFDGLMDTVITHAEALA